MRTDSLSAEVKEFLERASTQTFLNTAQHFISLLETESSSREAFYKEVHIALIDLYAAGHKLDQLDINNSDYARKFERDTIFEDNNVGLISTLGEGCYYWEVFDPTYSEQDIEPTQGWLVDDFGDIYRDLKIELAKINKVGTDEAVEDALWQLKWSFNHHWGGHCINALRALHYLRYDGKLSN